MKFYIDFLHRLKPMRSAQLLRIMKVIIIIMTTCLLQVSALGFAQRVTYVQKGATLEQLFKEIRRQTGYNVLWSADKIDAGRKLDLNFKSTPLEEVLRKSLEGQPFVYTIEDKTIVIKAKKLSLIEEMKENLVSFFQGDSVIFKGRVFDWYGAPLAGASIKIKGTNKATFTTKEGNFAIFAASNAVLQVSYVGYKTQELQMRREDAGTLIKFNMKLAEQNLNEIGIVSTGYQDLPKERATGSFEVITAKDLQHSTNTNVLKRLEGITTSMDFNKQLQNNLSSNGKNLPPLTYMTIRGKNTFSPSATKDPFATSGQPLVVIDGIASPYSIDNINPNDVESITILKDAAAASVWGSKAANGVIVVKTKRGKFESPTSVSFNSTLNITEKINLFYKEFMSVSDFIDAQLEIYKHKYPGDEYVEDPTDVIQPQPVMSPVAELINSFRMGKIGETVYNTQLDILRGNDIRRDYDKYLLRNAVIQSYSIALSGGSKLYAYNLSGGYDNTLDNSVTSSNDRATLSYNVNLKPLKNLLLQSGISYSQSNNQNQAPNNYMVNGVSNQSAFYPYNRLADDQGNPLPVIIDFRPIFLEKLAAKHGNKILDMTYKPLEDMKLGYSKTKSHNLNLNLNANYNISSVFSVNLIYNYSWGLSKQNDLIAANSYHMRSLINKFTTPPDNDLVPVPYVRNVPLGARYSPVNTKSNIQTLRGQLNVNKVWNVKHVLSAIAVIDISQNYIRNILKRYYGYNEDNKTSKNIDYDTYLYTLYNDADYGFDSDIIFNDQSDLFFKQRAIGLSSNAAYTFDRRYTLSGSIRKDMSSAFGRNTNKNGTPFFSVGGSWSINNESFYKLSWLPYLQLKLTYGYNGNVNGSVYPTPLLTYQPPASGNLLPYAVTKNGNNPKLRPEKSGIINLGLNFGTRNNRLSGSIEYYIRNTTDMMFTSPLDPSTGFATLDYNSASIRSKGVDATLNSLNLQAGLFRWNSSFRFSYNRVKTTKIYTANKMTAGALIGGSINFNEGADLSRVYAYRWGGLDPETGNPRGYLNGEPVVVTDNYTILSNADPSTARLFGSSVPVYYGSFGNAFSYRNFSVSALFMYKLGYYFRRPKSSELVHYADLFEPNIPQQLQAAEYADRWQKPGDEVHTNVPSLIFPGNRNRDLFYQFSEINVLKADHIRLQEINFSYTLSKTNWIIKNPRIYANVNNLGLAWKANKKGLDPEVNDYPLPRIYSFGLSANF